MLSLIVYILCYRNDPTEPFGAGSCPEFRLLFYVLDKFVVGGCNIVEESCVAMLPKCPRGEDDDGVRPFAEAGSHAGRRCHPPAEEAGSAIRGKGGNAAPCHDVVPNDAREDAADKEVVQCLIVLAAQLANGVMRKVVARSPVGGPASVERGKPEEDLRIGRSPSLPDGAPEWRGGGANEQRVVG